jgi:hypothetical protein
LPDMQNKLTFVSEDILERTSLIQKKISFSI